MMRENWKRRARRAGIVLGALLAAAAIAWWTGLPQERLVAWAIRQNLGAEAVVQWGGIAPELRIKRLELYPDADAKRAGDPLLVAEDIAIAYKLFPADGRRVPLVRIGRAELTADIRDPEKPNYRFLFSREAGSAAATSGPSDTYIPKSITVDAVTVVSRTANGRGTFGPVQLVADVTDLSTAAAMYRSARATVAWVAVDGEKTDVSNIVLEGEAKINADTFAWKQKLDAPGLAYTILTAEGDLTGSDPVVNARVTEFTLAGNRLAAFLEAIDAPLRFDEFDIESGEAQVVLAESPRFAAKASASMRAPALGGAAQPLYADTARVQLDAVREDELAAKVTMTLSQDQTVTAELRGDDLAGAATLDSGQWTRAQLLAALPEAFRGNVQKLGFESFLASADVEWSEDGFVAKASASSQGGGESTPPIYWALDAKGPRDTFAGVEGTLEARLGDRRINATATYTGDDTYHAEARIEEVQIGPWVQLFAGDEAAEGVLGTIEGAILAQANGKDAPLTITPEFHLRQFAYGDVALDEITLAGSMEYDAVEQRLEIDELRADCVDGMTMFRLSNFSYHTDDRIGVGEFAAGANLGVVGMALGYPELFGSSTFDEGTIRIRRSDIEIGCRVFSDYVGWVDPLLPYGVHLTGALAVEFNLDRREGELTHGEAKVGDGTTLRFVDTTFKAEPLLAQGRFECDSDLQVAVAMGWMAEADGSLVERSAFRLDADGFAADWTLNLDAAKLILPENAGTAEHLAFEGSGTYRDGLGGSGSVRAAKLTAGGGSILDAAGPATFEGETMIISPATGTLFGGQVRAQVDVGVLIEDMPIVLTGSFDEIDLAIFTDEVKPPNTSLTGTALGTINVLYSAKGLDSFTFDASAPGGLSVNRSLVSDLLQSDKFLAGAGERIAERAMDKLLGTAPQRPFDTGRMHVYLDSGKIQGTAELRSVKTEAYNGLNLTVNLDMDQSALAEALKVLEESNLGNVEF